jgi:Xaa-Pro dipeptidase
MTDLHRNKLISLFSDKPGHLIYLRGAEVSYRYDTDYEYAFRQESNFMYLTGIQEPGFHILLDPARNEFLLFVPKRDAMFAVWNGVVRSLDEYAGRLRPDQIFFDEDLYGEIGKRNPEVVHCLDTAQAAVIDDMGYQTDTGLLKDALAWCRCQKTKPELDMLRRASAVASEAHVAAMKGLRPGMYEYQMKALYEHEVVGRGLVHHPYNGIHGSGENSAILHYTESARRIEEGDLYLIDAGAEYNGYAADITRTYPAGGRFSGIQAAIYDVVLKALNDAIAMIRPGVAMEDMHTAACRIILEGLKDTGLVTGEIDTMMEKNIFALFFPHGLGHFLGLDTHDVGGYPKGVKRIDRPGYRYLRARRILEPGMVLTVEPGIYFIPALLRPALDHPEQSGFLNREKVQQMFYFGGIRIEDNLIVTENGHENMTRVPKDRADIEALMRD